MARDDKGRIRVVVIDVEGSNSTLQNALQTAANALQRPALPGARPAKQLPPVKGKRGRPAGSDTNGDDSHAPEPGLYDEVETDADVDGEEQQVIDSQVVKARKEKLTLVDIDPDEGEMSFRKFAELKHPVEHFDRYLVVAFWFKTYKNIDTITPNHVFTCYRFLDGEWEMPKNWGQTFRDMKRKHLFDNGEGRKSWKITRVGEDKVKRMGTTGTGEAAAGE